MAAFVSTGIYYWFTIWPGLKDIGKYPKLKIPSIALKIPSVPALKSSGKAFRSHDLPKLLE
jgi:hypothetical protein